MNRFGILFKPLMWCMAILLAAFVAGCGSGGGGGGGGGGEGSSGSSASNPGSVCSGGTCVSLGTAGTYVILTKSGVTNVPTSAVTGNIGVSPIAAIGITGFSLTKDASGTFSTSHQVDGRVFAADYTAPTPANLTTAVNDTNTAYGDASSRAPLDTGLGAGNIGGLVIPPGVHKWTTAVTINSNLTLTGSATDVWIFQVSGTITEANGIHVILAGALPQNVFWQTAGGAIIGTGATFEGIILSGTSITVGSGSTINGRLYANSDVTLITDTVTRPGP